MGKKKVKSTYDSLGGKKGAARDAAIAKAQAEYEAEQKKRDAKKKKKK